jgi:hypothetical protein
VTTPQPDPVIEVVASLFDKIAGELEELALTTRQGADGLRAESARRDAGESDDLRHSLRVVAKDWDKS